MNGRPVSKRYRQFVPEYISVGFNGTQAVLNLGWTDKRKSANVIAHRLLSNVNCRKLIDSHIMNAKISADEVLAELSGIARADWKDFLTIKYGENGEIAYAKLQLGDKLKALELAGKHHKLFTDKVETTNKADNDSKSFIFNLIADSAADSGKDPYDIELELQTRLAMKENADGSPRRSYDPNCDPNVVPECWPSGNLLADKPQQTKGLM